MTGSQEQAYPCSDIDRFASIILKLLQQAAGNALSPGFNPFPAEGAQACFFLTSSMTVTSGGARKRMGGPQVPVPRLV